MVESVFEFGDSQIADLMIPRPDIVALNLNDPITKNFEIIERTGHTRYPIYQDTLDSIIGIISIRDLWLIAHKNTEVDFSKIMQDILVVPDNMKALDLIRRFKTATSPLAVIIDEYGSVVGLITLHDLLEALVGDLSRVDQDDEEPLITRRHDGSWLIDGRTSPEELYEITGIDCSEESSKGGFRTMAGFILYKMGSIPATGDYFSYDGNEYEVVDMDGHRIDKILITRLPSPENL